MRPPVTRREHPDETSNIQDRVVGGVDNPAIVKSTVVITCPAIDKLEITVSHAVSTFMPLILPDTFSLSADVTTDLFTDTSCVPS